MTRALSATKALEVWRGALVESLQRNGPDLSQRQMALLMTVYLSRPPHTVRGLAENLGISKPAVTRALDRLRDHGYIRRKVDPTDRRSVLVQRTVKGSVFLSEFGESVARLAKEPPPALAADRARG